MANEKEIKAKVVINSEEAEKDWKEFTDTLIKDWKKTQSSLRGLGDSDARPFKQITSVFNDILTKRGTFRKSIDQDSNYFQKRTHELTEYLTRDIKTASTKIKSEISDIGKKFKEETDEMSKTTTSGFMKNLKNKIGEITQGLRYRTGVFLSYRGISATLGALNDLAKSTVDLQSKFANIQAITSATDTDMEKLRNTILKVGEASKFSVEDIAEATTQLGQAGLTANEINDVLETTTQLAAATGANLSNTIDLMTSALAVWGLNSEEASHLSDVMVTGMNRTKATLETFRMAVQYAGATMASLNVNFDEFASVAAAAANAGVRASVIGTGLRAMTSELISPTKRMIKGLADLGLTTDDVNIGTKGLVNVLQTLKDAGLNASNAYDLFGKRAAQFVLAAEGQLDVTNQLQIAFAESGATLKAYSTQMDTVAAQWEAMANTIKEAAYRASGATHGFIHDTLVAIKNLIKSALEDSVDELNELTSEYKNNIKSLESYQKVLQAIENRNYGNDTQTAIKDTNDLIESINKLWGKNLDLIESTEQLAEARKKAADALWEEKRAQVELYNRNIDKTREEIITSSLNDISGGERRSIRKSFRGAIGGKDLTDEQIDNDIKDAFEKRVSEYEEQLRSKKTSQSQIQEDISKIDDEIQKSLLTRALNAASDLIQRNPFDKINFEEMEKQREALEEYREQMSGINTNLKSILIEREEDINNITADSLKTKYEDIEKQITDIQRKIQDDARIKDPAAKKKLLETLNSADSSLRDHFFKLIDSLRALWEGRDNRIKANEFQNLKDEDLKVTDPLAYQMELDKRKKKEEEEAKRRQREADRAAKDAQAREMAGWKAKITAVGYESDIAKAQREGRIQKVGSLWGDETAANLLSESAKTAGFFDSYKEMQKKSQILSDMKEKYGDLLASYKEMSVEEQEQARGDDKRLATMLDLEKEVEKAKYTFGDMGFSEEDLQLLEGKIAEYNEKVAENSKTMWGTMENAAAEYALSLHKTVGDMNKVLTNFTKEGLSVFTDNFTNAVTSIAKGTSSIKDAFRNMISDILSSLGTYLIKVGVMAAALAALNAIPGVSAALGIQDALAKTKAVTDAAEYTSIASTAAGLISNFTSSSDQAKDSKATGGYVSRGIPNRDSVNTKLMPGEYVLKKSAVDALGTNFLNDLNNNAAQTLAGTAASLVSPETDTSSNSEPAVVNVWVVSKEEEAQMGPNDVIATIGRDIMTGGQTRRLIQSVVAGRK